MKFQFLSMADNNVRRKLFLEFPPVTTEQWRSKIEQDLKGVSFDKLIWKTNEGIEVLPFYRQEDLEGKEHLSSIRNAFIRKEKNTIDPNDWEIRQDIYVHDLRNANTAALDALDHGAVSLGYIIPESLKADHNSFSRLLKDIHIENISLNFISHKDALNISGFLFSEIKKRGIDPLNIFGSISHDPLGYLSTHGKYYSSEKDEFNLLTELFRLTSSFFPNLRLIGISPYIFHNSGGTAIQELGFSLAMISDYLNILSTAGIDPSSAVRSMQANFAIGSSYFMEIAKLRAARLLFARMVKAWNVDEEKSNRIFIHCRTSEWTQTIYEPSINILRATTQSMSAVAGGADSISVTPNDFSYRQPDTFSERIALNIQIILKEEAYFNKVADPASGSYYIESLTDLLVEKAWDLFLETEDLGGYLQAFKNGYIQKLVSEKSLEKDLNLSRRKEVMVGINQYIDPSEKKPADLDTGIAFPEKVQDDQLIAPALKKYRKSIRFEEIRRRTENSRSGTPVVFLLPFGKPALRRARAEFMAHFFSSAGFEIIDHHGFHSIRDGIESLKKLKARIVVFCSSDEEYLQLTSGDIRDLGEEVIPVIAGYPRESVDELRSMGIEHFIHIKSDMVEELKNFQQLLGI